SEAGPRKTVVRRGTNGVWIPSHRSGVAPMQEVDALILADSPHAQTELLGLTLLERGHRVATKVGARRVFVVDGADAARQLPTWARDRGNAALVVMRAGD